MSKIYKEGMLYLDLSLIWQIAYVQLLDRLFINGMPVDGCNKKQYEKLLKVWLNYKEATND